MRVTDCPRNDRQACGTGVLAGYPLVDLDVRLTGGAFDEGESTEMGFRNAATSALWDGAKAAAPTGCTAISRSGSRPSGGT